MVSPEAMVGETHGALLPGGIAAWGVPADGCPGALPITHDYSQFPTITHNHSDGLKQVHGRVTPFAVLGLAHGERRWRLWLNPNRCDVEHRLAANMS